MSVHSALNMGCGTSQLAVRPTSRALMEDGLAAALSSRDDKAADQIFDALDKNGDGDLEPEEVRSIDVFPAHAD